MRDCTTGRRVRTEVRTRLQHGSSSRSSPGAASTSGPRNGSPTNLWSIGFVIDRRTVSRHLTRLGLGRRRFIDPGGENNRKPGKITARRPGHMVHLDVKKVGRIPDGGGWRIHGRGSDQAEVASRAKSAGAKRGYVYLLSTTGRWSATSASWPRKSSTPASSPARAPGQPRSQCGTSTTATIGRIVLPPESRQQHASARASPTSSPHTTRVAIFGWRKPPGVP